MCIIPFCVCAGKLQGQKYEKWLDIARRVYDAKGVCPTLTTVQSGGTEAKVVIRVKENTARGYSDFTLGGGDLRSLISEQHDPTGQNPAGRPRLADAHNRKHGNLRGQI